MLILVVNVLAVNGALPLYIVSKSVYALHIASKSVFYTLSSVQKCLIDALSVLFQVEMREVRRLREELDAGRPEQEVTESARACSYFLS